MKKKIVKKAAKKVVKKAATKKTKEAALKVPAAGVKLKPSEGKELFESTEKILKVAFTSKGTVIEANKISLDDMKRLVTILVSDYIIPQSTASFAEVV